MLCLCDKHLPRPDPYQINDVLSENVSMNLTQIHSIPFGTEGSDDLYHEVLNQDFVFIDSSPNWAYEILQTFSFLTF